TPLGCSISQFFTFARKYSSQSWEPYRLSQSLLEVILIKEASFLASIFMTAIICRALRGFFSRVRKISN
ncbi:MAG: hypothetical protein K1W12_11050, partial [Turicimonas muris]